MDKIYKYGKKIRIRVKEQGKLFYVPFLFHYLLIPILVLLSYRNYGIGDETRNVIISFSQYFTPVLASWWIFSCLVKYIDGEGNEIFYIQDRIKAKEVLGFLVLYIVSNTFPFLFYSRLFDHMWLEWIRIVIESMLFASAAYCFSFLLQNIAFAIVVVVVYAFSSVFFMGMGSPVWRYFDGRDMTAGLFMDKYLFLFLAAVGLFLIGILLNYKKQTYR